MPGTNASLNAMEFYKWPKDIKKIILYLGDFKAEISEKYTDKWPDVTWIEINRSFWHEHKTNFWFCVFSDVFHTVKHLKDYDVVLLWSADQCIVNDFTDYFKIAECLDKVILGTNEQGNITFNALSTKWPYGHTWDIPFTDQPFFVPRSKFNLLELMLDFQRREKCNLSRMDSISYAVRDLKLDIFQVPGNLWINNTPYVMPIHVVDKELALYTYSTRMNAFHRKYWNVGYAKRYVGGNKIGIDNVKKFNAIYNYLDTKCRVPWTEGLEVWK